MRGPISRITAYSRSRWILLFLLVAFAVPALAQNTKGERPVNNERQIRETKSKTVKRKDKSKTRDLAGRRLRTKNKSSANSANVGIRQPNPYAGRPRVTTDRAAKTQKRTYSERPSERPRAPKGDLAGHPIRTAKPRRTEAVRANVYPQSGPYMNNPDRRPKHDRPARIETTASGQPIIRRMPQQKERAWKGDLKGRPVAPPRSVTSQRQNTYPQPIPYSKYDKSRRPGDRAISNERELKQTSRLTRPPRTKSIGGGGYPDTPKKGFVQRGRKNVYWGKFSKGEKPFTRDLTGAPLTKRNYRSPAPGLVGRDTLLHFGRKPGGDATFSGRRKESLSPGAKGSWRGDISGSQLRRFTPSHGKGGNRPLPGAGIPTRRRGETVGKPVPGKGAGIGADALARGMARTKGKPTKGFSWQGEDFTGFMKTRGRGVPADARRVGSYSGNLRGGQGKMFMDQGEGFSGSIKVRKGSSEAVKASGFRGHLRTGEGKTFEYQGEGFGGSHKVRNIPFKAERVSTFSGNLRVGQGKTFEYQGEGFTGFMKVRKKSSDAEKASSFSGHILGGQGKMFVDQGEGFSGFIKAKKPLKGGGSVSGHWNNNNTPITQNRLPAGASKPINFAGHLRSGEGKTFEEQGEGFSGYLKAKRPAKGGGSVSGHWNNRNEPIAQKNLPAAATRPINFAGHLRTGQGKTFEDQGEGFSGFIKAKRPAKGGGSVSGNLWNNNGEPIAKMERKGVAVAAADFRGKDKVSLSRFNMEVADTKGKVTMKRDFTQSPKAVQESTKKHQPNRAGFQIEGMRVRVERQKYSDREHTADGALRGVGPKRGSVRASEFSTGALTPERRHNPFAVDEAMKGTYYSSGGGKMGTFHGNLKVKKFSSDRKLHPDAKFAHIKEHNVKEQRTIVTNVKLFWTKLFHKSESQPTVVRQKGQRPSYSKGEFGIWEEKDANKNWAEQVKKPKTP